MFCFLGAAACSADPQRSLHQCPATANDGALPTGVHGDIYWVNW